MIFRKNTLRFGLLAFALSFGGVAASIAQASEAPFEACRSWMVADFSRVSASMALISARLQIVDAEVDEMRRRLEGEQALAYGASLIDNPDRLDVLHQWVSNWSGDVMRWQEAIDRIAVQSIRECSTAQILSVEDHTSHLIRSLTRLEGQLHQVNRKLNGVYSQINWVHDTIPYPEERL